MYRGIIEIGAFLMVMFFPVFFRLNYLECINLCVVSRLGFSYILHIYNALVLYCFSSSTFIFLFLSFEKIGEVANDNNVNCPYSMDSQIRFERPKNLGDWLYIDSTAHEMRANHAVAICNLTRPGPEISWN